MGEGLQSAISIALSKIKQEKKDIFTIPQLSQYCARIGYQITEIQYDPNSNDDLNPDLFEGPTLLLCKTSKSEPTWYVYSDKKLYRNYTLHQPPSDLIVLKSVELKRQTKQSEGRILYSNKKPENTILEKKESPVLKTGKYVDITSRK